MVADNSKIVILIHRQGRPDRARQGKAKPLAISILFLFF
jgi:hypothetical protein